MLQRDFKTRKGSRIFIILEGRMATNLAQGLYNTGPVLGITLNSAY